MNIREKIEEAVRQHGLNPDFPTLEESTDDILRVVVEWIKSADWPQQTDEVSSARPQDALATAFKEATHRPPVPEDADFPDWSSEIDEHPRYPAWNDAFNLMVRAFYIYQASIRARAPQDDVAIARGTLLGAQSDYFKVAEDLDYA
jgi:hypothetical protein